MICTPRDVALHPPWFIARFSLLFHWTIWNRRRHRRHRRRRPEAQADGASRWRKPGPGVAKATLLLVSHFHLIEAEAKQEEHLFVRQWPVYTLSPLSVPACPVER